MTDRISCCVPFCRRTRRANQELVTVELGGYSDGDTVTTDINEEWVCGGHWRLVSAGLRSLRSGAKRRLKARNTLRSLLVFIRVWQRCKRAAIETAGGLR